MKKRETRNLGTSFIYFYVLPQSIQMKTLEHKQMQTLFCYDDINHMDIYMNVNVSHVKLLIVFAYNVR